MHVGYVGRSHCRDRGQSVGCPGFEFRILNKSWFCGEINDRKSLACYVKSTRTISDTNMMDKNAGM